MNLANLHNLSIATNIAMSLAVGSIAQAEIPDDINELENILVTGTYSSVEQTLARRWAV